MTKLKTLKDLGSESCLAGHKIYNSEELRQEAEYWKITSISLIIISTILLSVFMIMVMYQYNYNNPIQEIQEDIRLCKDYCKEKMSSNQNITDCKFQYVTDITNIKHEEWELFHCVLYYKDNHTYGKFVGDFDDLK